jgi:hypothetical protein
VRECVRVFAVKEDPMPLESIAMQKMVGMSPTEQGWNVTPSLFVPIERDEGKTGAPIAESDARVTLTMEAARAAFEEIDKNHDEELSQIEYIKALRRNPELAKRLGTNSQKKFGNSDFTSYITDF